MGKPVIAITGSAGKTTTKEMLASILGQRFRTFKSFENGNDTWFTSQYKKQIRVADQAVVLEYGMKKKGDIQSHCRLIKPWLGIITNVGKAHIGHFKDGLRGIAAAKSELIRGMDPSGVLFISRDDKNSRLLHVKAFKGKVLTIGIHGPADYRAEKVTYTGNGAKFRVRLKRKTRVFFIPCYGECNVYNALFAIAVSHYLGCSVSQIRTGLKRMERPYARLSIRKTKNRIVIIDDSFNTKPELDPAVSVLEHVGSGNRRKIAVLGDIKDLGKYAKSIHLAQGSKLGKKGLYRLYTYGLNSRYLGVGAMKSGLPYKKIKHFTCIPALKGQLSKHLRPGTVFLVKGSTNGNKVKLMHVVEWMLRKA
ncbi:UDP-N-acetylmuramoyl-tripeptide--D-alanyl-D-alanine ligase [Paenibacillus sp. A3M_27_13]|uniref:UDP-N-acetylmuramoyl-tripeptide--D-alanyl-D- alanine ligase n=1 Tax=Paenibacillus sp. A3M_27_13 TaxID=2962029 RepID=UPI0020B7FBBF|nr:UDP-N-acetylmuramoyl-tripeptide--D-alanyl-D-alanine ligase [Paenibacillus sp. A3M_27_13]MCP3746739.1 UDP-N-acetylmuramoyl-tripeptide--D-alanyl-D-alanine ligase [Paenibacillus sp. A3M_27_13]